MELKSPAFEAGGMMPKPYTCDGQDASPPLSLVWCSQPQPRVEIRRVLRVEEGRCDVATLE